MSDLLVTFGTLFKISKTASNIASFVTGSGLIQILGEVGTRHVQAAILALKDSTASPHPRDRINSAANSLTEAFTLLSPRYQASVSRFFREITPGFGHHQTKLYMRSAICAVLIALCYTYLGESKSNRSKWLKRAEEELKNWSSLYDTVNQTRASPHSFPQSDPQAVKYAAETLEKFEMIKKHLLSK